MRLRVHITVAIVTIQHPIYFQNVAIGRSTLLFVNAVLPSKIVKIITRELVSCSIEAQNNLSVH